MYAALGIDDEGHESHADCESKPAENKRSNSHGKDLLHPSVVASLERAADPEADHTLRCAVQQYCFELPLSHFVLAALIQYLLVRRAASAVKSSCF